MKRLLSFCISILFYAGWLSAQVAPPSPVMPPQRGSNIRLGEISETLFSAKERQREINGKADRTYSSKTVKVTFTFPPLEEEWIIPWGCIYIYNDEGFFEEVWVHNDESNRSCECEVPEGTYDCLTVFTPVPSYEKMENVRHFYYIAEAVKFTDGAIINMNPEECTVCLKMQPVNPDGEKCRLGKYSNDENWSWTILEEGNISGDRIMKSIIYKGRIIEEQDFFGGSWELVPGPTGERDPQLMNNFYVNPVSDNYTFRVIHLMSPLPDDDCTYIAVTEAQGAIEGEYTNASYSFENLGFTPTLFGKDYPWIDQDDTQMSPYRIEVRNRNGHAVSPIGGTDTSIFNVYTAPPKTPVTEENIYFSYNKIFTDVFIPVSDTYAITRWIKSGDIAVGESIPCMCFNAIFDLNLDSPGEGTLEVYPGNSCYMCVTDNTDLNFGSSAPLLVNYFVPGNNKETLDSRSMDASYIGRLGEYIASDIMFSDCYLEVDGEEVASDYYATQSWIYEHPDVKGLYAVDLATYNFEIEGISGWNKSRILFDTRRADSMPPTVTMMQMRNEEGMVTQTFRTPEEATILLSAADLSLQFGDPVEEEYIPFCFDVSQPEKVLAYCTPTEGDSSISEEILLEIQPDLFYSPGYGAFYQGSLSGLTLPSSTGWFDLTLVVEDAAGNSQTQQISPAFKIESLAGIKEMMEEKVRVVGNSIIAPVDAKIYNLSGLRVTSEGLPAGIYFVSLPSCTVKVAVR